MRTIKKALSFVLTAVMCAGMLCVPVFADTDAKELEPSDKWWVAKSGYATTNTTDYIRAHGSARTGFVAFDASQLQINSGTLQEYVENAPSITLSMYQINTKVTGEFTSKIFGIAENKDSHSSTAQYDETLYVAGEHIGDITGTGETDVSIDVTDYVKVQTDGKYVFRVAGFGSADVRYNSIKLNFNYSDEAVAESAIAAIESIGELYAEDFLLPTEGKYDTTIVWSSSDTDVIAIEGGNASVKRPSEAVGDKTVTLTASITVGEVTKTKEFLVRVPALASSDVVKVLSSADTYVQKNYGDNNYNANNKFLINGSGRHNFARFNALDVTSDEVCVATLNLYLYEVKKPSESGTFGMNVYGLTDNDKTLWDESTLTYNMGAEAGILNSDKDAGYGAGELAATSAINADLTGSYISIDVTDYIKSQTDGIYSFRFYGDAAEASFYTRENEIYAPYIEILRGDTGAVAADKKALKFPEEAADGIYESMVLPSVGEYGSNIEWTTESDIIEITADGDVITVNPGVVTEPTKVILKATITKGEKTEEKVMELTVIPPVTDGEDVIADAAAIVLPDKIYGSFTLPVAGEKGSDIAWSTESGLITIDGAQATAAEVAEETKVTLTATVTKGKAQEIRNIEITIIPQNSGEADEADAAADAAAISLPKAVYGSFNLPLEGERGTQISWSSDSADITIDGAQATVSDALNEVTKITLKATVTKNEAEHTRDIEITLLPSIITFTTDGEETADFTEGQHVTAGTLAGAELAEGEKLYIATYNADGVMLHIWAIGYGTRVDITADSGLAEIGVFVWNNMKPVAARSIRVKAAE